MNTADSFSSVMLDLWQSFWWAWPLVFLLMLLIQAAAGRQAKSPLRLRGEAQLDASIYRSFHHLRIPDGNQTCRLEHVYVSRFGVFVVMGKRYNGDVCGTEQQSKWMCKLGVLRWWFQNPLKQNQHQIQALVQLLDLPENYFHSVVVFTGDSSRFTTPMPANVCTLNTFSRYIKKFNQPLLNEQQLSGAIFVLSSKQFVAGNAKSMPRLNTH